MDDYKLKYFKYKNKYIQLKKQMSCEIPKVNLADGFDSCGYDGGFNSDTYFNKVDNNKVVDDLKPEIKELLKLQRINCKNEFYN